MPPFSTTYNYSDPTRGILLIGRKLIFLPWVTAIEPYRRYSGDSQPEDAKRVGFIFRTNVKWLLMQQLRKYTILSKKLWEKTMSKVELIKKAIKEGTYDWNAAICGAAERIEQNPESLLWR